MNAAGGGIHHNSESSFVQLLLNIDDAFHQLAVSGDGGKPKFCGANSIMRSDAYIASGGHQPAYRRKENIPIRRALMNKDPSSVRSLPDAWIATSARRQETLFHTGNIGGDPRRNFYGPDDASEIYLGSSSPIAEIDAMPSTEKRRRIGMFLSDLLMKHIFFALMSNSSIRKHREDREKSILIIRSNSECTSVAQSIVVRFIGVCQKFGLDISINESYEVSLNSSDSIFAPALAK